MFQEILSQSDFYQLPGVHDCDAISHVLYHVHVMCNEKKTDLALLLNFSQEIKDLRLDGSVECARGFVQDDELWIQH